MRPREVVGKKMYLEITLKDGVVTMLVFEVLCKVVFVKSFHG